MVIQTEKTQHFVDAAFYFRLLEPAAAQTIGDVLEHAQMWKECVVLKDNDRSAPLRRNLVDALAFDSDVVSGVIEDLDLLFDKFKELMCGPAQEYLALCKGPVDDKTVERAIDTFTDQDKREAFYRVYKQIQTL